jgi:hypothetical protein
MGIAGEVIKENHRNPDNIYLWDEVELNLPGSKNYDSIKPWVSKLCLKDGQIAADLFIYVDDL